MNSFIKHRWFSLKHMNSFIKHRWVSAISSSHNSIFSLCMIKRGNNFTKENMVFKNPDRVWNPVRVNAVKWKSVLLFYSVSSFVFAFYIINKRLINYFIPSGSWIITRKIPVAGIFRTCFVKIFNRLKYNLHFCLNIFFF